MDYNLYNETNLAASSLSYQNASSSSVTTTGKPEDDPIMASVFKEFSESYNQSNENRGEPASEKVVTLYQLPLRKLFEKLHLKNC